MTTLRARNSIKGIKPDGSYTEPGELFETDEVTAQKLLDIDAAEEVAENEEAGDDEANRQAAEARTALLESISAAMDIESLTALLPEIPQADQELVDAYDARRDELEEPHH